jgi:F420-dependent oxidoreductase-like protein
LPGKAPVGSVGRLVELRIFTEPQQGATYDELLAIARLSEELGFDAFFRSDHYLKMGDGSGLPGPTDAWITLAGLARDTERIRLGTMVTAATFRLPGPLAIAVATVDAMSGGRVDFGIGSGWYEEEHRNYGIPFPSMKERFDRLEEQLAIITGLWTTPDGETFSFAGEHFALVDSPALPKPVQSPRPPVIIGGWGAKRTPAIAARFADEYNIPMPPPGVAPGMFANVDQACEAIGRNPAEIIKSIALVACVGSDEAEYQRRVKAIGRDPDELRAGGLAGTVEEARRAFERYTADGPTRLYLQVLDVRDLDHVRLLADTFR